MIINGTGLLQAGPIRNMESEKLRSHGVSYGLSEAGYDIRIAQDVTFYKMEKIPFGRLVQVDGRRKVGRFTIASAMEEFDMPDNLVGLVKDKSTWARKGLSVFNTVIEPGWKGFLTLELVYNGNDTLHIPAGAGIAHVLFQTIAEPVEYTGKYQNQPAGATESKWD